MQSVLNFESAPVQKKRALSPLLEMGAYELLWEKENLSFKKLAEKLKEYPGTFLSDLVDVNDAVEAAKKVLGIFKQNGIKGFGVRIHRAGEYPLRLRDAVYPVELLYYLGLWELVETRCIAIVGTRNPSQEGEKDARDLTEHLVAKDWTIVSGLAQGIDTIAHTTAMNKNGRTIAVLGTPICDVYPKHNRELQKKIAREFLVISQIPVLRYFHQHPPQNRLFFPERNITMSALTDATVIVEAGNTSGTLIQARAAIAQKRKLFILDRCFHNSALTWPAKYEQQGAYRVKDFSEISTILNGRPGTHKN